ncbi:MAG: PAS domain S-box protein [Anaerolineae bacterium]|nr:PAS domain S-box protein [Anaerolineae bacterium]
MFAHPPNRWKGLLTAVIVVLIATAIKSLLNPLYGVESPFLLFFSAVVISAWLGGFSAGVLATVLAALLADYFFLIPYFSFNLMPHQALRLLTFITEGLIISFLSHRFWVSRQRADHEYQQRLTAERSLRENEEQFRLLIENATEYAIILLNDQGQINSWNRGAERITGYAKEEAIGQPLDLFYLEVDRIIGRPQQTLKAVARDRPFEQEIEQRHKTGRHFYAHLCLTAIYSDQGELRGYSLITRDITERKQAAQELERRVRERTAQLHELNQQLETFAYRVSHDLGAPLRSIQGFTTILLEDHSENLNGQGRDYLRRIGRGAEKLDRLVSDLLTYSRFSSEKVPLEPLDLGAIVDDLLTRLGVDHAIDVMRPFPPCLGNRVIVTQILQNLIHNALTYTSPQRTPQVTVTTELQGDQLRIVVSDNGIGIAPADHERIFRPFERVDPRYPGSGIGLAIVSNGMKRMNGRYGLESVLGEGSRFWFELPALVPTDHTP